MNNIPIFVISLETATKRRKTLQRSLTNENIEFNFFDATNGNTLLDDQVFEINKQAYHLTNGFIKKLSKNECGCAISHLNIYKKIIKEKITQAIIFEDDVDFDFRLKKFIRTIETNLNVEKKYELILLGYSENAKEYKRDALISIWDRKKIGEFTIGKPAEWYWGAFAYYITYNGAMKMLKSGTPIRMPADCLTANSKSHGIKFGCIKRPIVWPGKENNFSTIGEREYIELRTKIKKNKVYSSATKLSIMNILKKKLVPIILSTKNKAKVLRILFIEPSKFYSKKF